MLPSWGRFRDGTKQRDANCVDPDPPAHLGGGGGSRSPTAGLWARPVRVGLGAALGPRDLDVPVTAKAGASAVGGPHPYTDSHVGEGAAPRPPKETRSHFPRKFCQVFGEMRLFLY